MWALLRAAGLGTIGYFTPRLLAELGVPFDYFATEIASAIRGAPVIVESSLALAVIGGVFGVFLATLEIWKQPLGKLLELRKNSATKIAASMESVLEQLDGRINYADTELQENDTLRLKKWLSKIDYQRVFVGAAIPPDPDDLTQEQRTALNRCRGCYEELERYVDNVVANKSDYENRLQQTVGLYLHRARKLYEALIVFISTTK